MARDIGGTCPNCGTGFNLRQMIYNGILWWYRKVKRVSYAAIQLGKVLYIAYACKLHVVV